MTLLLVCVCVCVCRGLAVLTQPNKSWQSLHGNLDEVPLTLLCSPGSLTSDLCKSFLQLCTNFLLNLQKHHESHDLHTRRLDLVWSNCEQLSFKSNTLHRCPAENSHSHLTSAAAPQPLWWFFCSSSDIWLRMENVSCEERTKVKSSISH